MGCYACTAMPRFHYRTLVTAFGKLFNALIDVLITIFTCHPIVLFTLAHHLKIPLLPHQHFRLSEDRVLLPNLSYPHPMSRGVLS